MQEQVRYKHNLVLRLPLCPPSVLVGNISSKIAQRTTTTAKHKNTSIRPAQPPEHLDSSSAPYVCVYPIPSITIRLEHRSDQTSTDQTPGANSQRISAGRLARGRSWRGRGLGRGRGSIGAGLGGGILLFGDLGDLELGGLRGDGGSGLVGGDGLVEVELVSLLQGGAGDGLNGVFEVGGVDLLGDGEVVWGEGLLVDEDEGDDFGIGAGRVLE